MGYVFTKHGSILIIIIEVLYWFITISIFISIKTVIIGFINILIFIIRVVRVIITVIIAYKVKINTEI